MGIRVVLFDIDGTLVRMRGAGVRAMDRAFEALTGVSGAFEGVPMAGRTDRAITESALERTAVREETIGPVPAFLDRFFERYVAELEGEAYRGEPNVCPGVLAALDRLERRGVTAALATGNVPGAARVKLERFGLFSRFRFGGFGDFSAERAAVLRAAADEAVRRTGAVSADILVVGDTEHDVAAARAVGARVAAVATGPVPIDRLRGAGPDHLTATLADAVGRGWWDEWIGSSGSG